MKITELLSKDTILLHMEGSQKEEAINQLVDVLYKAEKISDRDSFKVEVLKREQLSTTGIGDGIAIPHAKTKVVKKAAIAFGKSVTGIDYESLDGKPSHLFFMIAAPDGANNTHLDALARLSGMLMKAEVRYQLLTATTSGEIIDIINKYDKEEVQETAPVGKKNFIVAVTACPTGIAHTYMAQEALNQAAKELGYAVKVETQGASGVENRLTDEDIKQADAVIIAADKKVELDRFVGKPLLQNSVSSAIKDAATLIQSSLQQPRYGNSDNTSTDYLDAIKQQKEERKKSSQTQGAYRHLMNGVSHMLPLVVAGGIFIALSTAIDINTKSSLSKAFSNIGGGSAFALFVPILAAFIAQSIADRPGFAAGLVGGWIGTQGAMYGDPHASAGYLGGILAGFLAGYITKWLNKGIRLPRSLEGVKPVLIIPFLSVGIVGLLMIYVIGGPIASLMSLLTNGLTNIGQSGSIGLGLLLGAMMAIDMGGPFNKVAYFFGVGLLGTGTHVSQVIMAAIMGAGMVPPLAMALATFIRKKVFTENERDAGKAAIILGLSFITEGAIPFATRDPFRVIPSIVIGSAITGALSMLFNVTNPAPHGGVFVFWLIGNWWLFIIAILVGVIVSALLVVFLKGNQLNKSAS